MEICYEAVANSPRGQRKQREREREGKRKSGGTGIMKAACQESMYILKIILEGINNRTSRMLIKQRVLKQSSIKMKPLKGFPRKRPQKLFCHSKSLSIHMATNPKSTGGTWAHACICRSR